MNDNAASSWPSMARPASVEPDVQVFHSAEDLPADMREFMDAQSPHSLQSSSGWFLNLERTVFTAERHIRYFTLREEGRPAAVLPLLLKPGALHTRAVALGNYYTCLYQPILRAGLGAPALACLFTAVRRQARGLSSLTLAPMDPDAPGFALIDQALALAGFARTRYFCFGNWYLQAPATWLAYLAGREGKVRSTIKRMAQRIAADDGSVEIITHAGDVARGLAAYNAVYAHSWKVPEPYPAFVPGLMDLCTRTNSLRLGLVWLKGEPIAAQLWIVTGQRAEIYKVAYNEAFKNCSPGTVLTARMMEQVLDHDHVTEVDYLIGDDPYKKTWMSHRRERWGLVAYNRRSMAGFALWAVESAKGLLRPVRGKLKAWTKGLPSTQ